MGATPALAVREAAAGEANILHTELTNRTPRSAMGATPALAVREAAAGEDKTSDATADSVLDAGPVKPNPSDDSADSALDAGPVKKQPIGKSLEFLNVVTELNSQVVNAVSDMHGKWERIQAIIDSGSTTPVMPTTLAQLYEPKESKASRSGVTYRVANGVEIPNLGEKCFPVITKEGSLRGYQSQCADVTTVLQSVNHLNSTGHGVWLDGKESFMIHKGTGEINRIDHDGRNFTQEMWVIPPDELANVAAEYEAQGFTGHQ